MPEVDLSGAEAPGATILLIEDDAETAAIVETYLVSAGLGVVVVTDGLEGLSAALALALDAIVLDRSLPGMEGLVLLGRLRVAGVSTPAMVLSARASVRDRIEGLEAGADDYLVKPFALDELLARLRVMLRRAAPRRRQAGSSSSPARSSSTSSAARFAVMTWRCRFSPKRCACLRN